MASVKIKRGFVHVGTNKAAGSNAITTLKDALAEEAKCNACGCDADQGFFVLPDLNTTDGTLYLVFVHGGALNLVEDTTANRALFKTCCQERAAGGATPSCDSLAE